jgi:hypothetical protein
MGENVLNSLRDFKLHSEIHPTIQYIKMDERNLVYHVQIRIQYNLTMSNHSFINFVLSSNPFNDINLI